MIAPPPTPASILPHDWFPSPLPANVTLGDRTWCYSSFSCLHFQSTRKTAIAIGDDTGIYHGTFFDLGPQGEVKIGNFCTIVGAVISTNGRVQIDDYAFIAHEVFISDTEVALPSKAAPAADSPINPGLSVHIGENSWICARAILLRGARIGPGAIVGAAAVVNFQVPPLAIVAGNPAKIVGWADESKGKH
jgi:acetyltransferase-like isoleucine patch superfamily enzyme